MKNYLIPIILIATYSYIHAQVGIPSPPKFSAETSLKGQVAVEGYSGPIGPIVPPPTDPGSIGVRGVGYTGVTGEARGDNGYGVYGDAGNGIHGVYGFADKFAQRGVFGEAAGSALYGVWGHASGSDGIGVFGNVLGEGEWAGYFSGGKGLLARPRLGVENFDPQYPIHVGQNNTNGNGAHVTNGGTWTNGSSRAFKEDFEYINPEEILTKVSGLAITKWKYKRTNEGDHIGPMAEDFYAAFGLGHDEKYITTTNADGVALAAIQALYFRLVAVEKRNEELQNKNESFSKRLKKFEKSNRQ